MTESVTEREVETTATPLSEKILGGVSSVLSRIGHQDERRIGAMDDNQNGMEDDSVWVDTGNETDGYGVYKAFEDAGFETFTAPEDEGARYFSTYGIPVEAVSQLQLSDIVRIKSGQTATVRNIRVAQDGGP